MFAGNSLLNALFVSKGVMVNNNIFLTLCNWCHHALAWFSQKELDKKEKLWRRIGVAFLLIFGSLLLKVVLLCYHFS